MAQAEQQRLPPLDGEGSEACRASGLAELGWGERLGPAGH
jgi:hypothetical protein